jgi:uncharacterized membrane protein YeaQ/YmgE (transglycosylase-associated protein family)
LECVDKVCDCGIGVVKALFGNVVGARLGQVGEILALSEMFVGVSHSPSQILMVCITVDCKSPMRVMKSKQEFHKQRYQNFWKASIIIALIGGAVAAAVFASQLSKEPMHSVHVLTHRPGLN